MKIELGGPMKNRVAYAVWDSRKSPEYLLCTGNVFSVCAFATTDRFTRKCVVVKPVEFRPK
jgi:hypothetical protein